MVRNSPAACVLQQQRPLSTVFDTCIRVPQQSRCPLLHAARNSPRHRTHNFPQPLQLCAHTSTWLSRCLPFMHQTVSAQVRMRCVQCAEYQAPKCCHLYALKGDQKLGNPAGELRH
jgi:hypothetical protein